MKSITSLSPALLCLLLSLSGCFTTQSGSWQDHIAPSKHVFDKSSIIASGYDNVWSNLVAWFAERNTRLAFLQKESGYIKTEFAQIYGDSTDCDCGIAPDGWKRNGNGIMGEINIVAKPIDSIHTSVTITISYICDYIDSNEPWRGSKMKTVDFYGESTGGLEKRIFQVISK